jgi:hypothetical protein
VRPDESPDRRLVAVNVAIVVPVSVWNALPKIAADRNEIYLNRDDAEDPAARIKFQNTC